jgi:cytolysin-activating lysine-acyltransferase
MGKRKQNGSAGLALAGGPCAAMSGGAMGLAGQWLAGNQKLQESVEWLVLPPLLAGQFRVWRRGATPVAYAAWALLDQATEARLLAGETRIAPAEWQRGDRPWLIYLLAPYGGLQRFAQELRSGVFAGREVRFLVRDAGVEPRMVVWSAVYPEPLDSASKAVRPPGRLVDSPRHP